MSAGYAELFLRFSSDQNPRRATITKQLAHRNPQR